MPFVFDVLKVLLSKTCKIHSPDLLFIRRYCTFVPLFLLLMIHLEETRLNTNRNSNPKENAKVQQRHCFIIKLYISRYHFSQIFTDFIQYFIIKKHIYIYIHIFVLNFSFFYLWPKSAKCDESFLLRRCSRPE